jgi:multiple RNA-binding domain-containing protein 1
MASLSSTHLYGRHLVIEYAKEENTEDITNLRKRANMDINAIKSSKKKQKFIDDKDEIDGLDDEDYD